MRLIPSLVAVAAVVACSDAFSPTIDNVAGEYTLDQLTTVTDTGGTKNWVAAGATFTISLGTNGTTTGQLFIPEGGAGGVDFNADMAGTWTLTDGIVGFDQTADSFVRDYLFSARENRLAADRNDPGIRVIVVLRK